MQSYYWIKLYHEILHDPKMGRLSDRLWRRTIELFLMAGQNGGDGELPDIGSMAWTLRTTDGELTDELEQLQELDIVELRDGLWFVIHFAERQTNMDAKERMSRMRNKQMRDEYYEPVTSRNTSVTEPVTTRNTEKSRVEKSRVDIDKSGGEVVAQTKPKPERAKAPPPPPAVQVFHANTGKNPARSLYQRIDEDIGRDEVSLQRWAAVIQGWLGCGWSPGNVNGMLDYFKRNEIPGTKGGNGRAKGGRDTRAGWAQSDGHSADDIARILAERERELSSVPGRSVDTSQGNSG